ncbi:MAG: ATP-binding protein [Lachnospiraceae bacterium]|nr:ATP-binding protein [Lachnospiraceae bacterium]
MPLTNQQYNFISRTYEKRRAENDYQLEQRKTEVYQKIPEFQELDQKIISTSMEHAHILLDPQSNRQLSRKELLDALHQKLENMKSYKLQLLTDAGYPKDYLEPHYTCDACQDTGYIDGRKCSCFRRLEVELLYDASQIRDLLETNNFSHLSYDYYQGDDLALFQNAVETCKKFINNFDSDYQNLLFYGTVGTGKSFLSGCVAKELIDQGKFVIYFSAIRLFESISSKMYTKELSDQLLDALYHSDLLIIDDLGAEYATDFTKSHLFNIVNERMCNRKAVIISTNFTTPDEIRTHYSDRMFSRVFRHYAFLKLTGTDIRIQQRRND